MRVELRVDEIASQVLNEPVMQFHVTELVPITPEVRAEIELLAYLAHQAWETIHDPEWRGTLQ